MKTSMSRWLAPLAGLLLLATGMSAHSQSMKPGLWEYESRMKSQSGEMESAMAEMRKQLEAMPAAERRQMEQMMAQSGIQFGGEKAGAQIVRICITPEEAAKLDLQSDPDCKQEITRRGGNTVNIRFTCGGEVPSKGEGTLTFRGDSAFSGKFRIETRDEGKTDQIEMTQEAKWLGSSCGDLQPRKPGRGG